MLYEVAFAKPLKNMHDVGSTDEAVSKNEIRHLGTAFGDGDIIQRWVLLNHPVLNSAFHFQAKCWLF